MSSNMAAKRKVMGRIDLDAAQQPQSPKAAPTQHGKAGSSGTGTASTTVRSPVSSPPLRRAVTTSSHVRARAKVDMSSLAGISALTGSSPVASPSHHPSYGNGSEFSRNNRPASIVSASASVLSAPPTTASHPSSASYFVRATPTFSPHTPRVGVTTATLPRPGSPSKLRQEEESIAAVQRPRLRTQTSDKGTPPLATLVRHIASSPSTTSQETTPRSSQNPAAAPHVASNGISGRHARTQSAHSTGASSVLSSTKAKVKISPPSSSSQQQPQQVFHRRSPSPTSSAVSSASRSPTITSTLLHGHPLRLASDDSTASSARASPPQQRISQGSSSMPSSRPASAIVAHTPSSPATLSHLPPQSAQSVKPRTRPALVNTWSSHSETTSNSEPATPALLSPGSNFIPTTSTHRRSQSIQQQQQAFFQFHPLTPTSEVDSVLSHSLDNSTNSVTSPPLEAVESEAASEAKRNRKILDLEITNKSLLAINAGLEVSKLKQAREIRELKRRLKEAIAGGGGGGLGRAMGLEAEDRAGLEEEEEDDEEDEEDEVVFKEDEELEAAHVRCKTLIDTMVQRARTSILSKAELPPLPSLFGSESERETKSGNRVLHPAEVEQLDMEGEGAVDGDEDESLLQMEEEEQRDADDKSVNAPDTRKSTLYQNQDEEDTSPVGDSLSTHGHEEDSFDRAVHRWSSSSLSSTGGGSRGD